MAATDFEARVARLEEHLLEPTPEEALDDAERCLARGDKGSADLYLAIAKGRQGRLERRTARLESTRDADSWDDDEID
jgi:hypothetical protein